MPALTLDALRQAVADVVPSRLPEFFQEIHDAFSQAGDEDSVFPIRHLYQRWAPRSRSSAARQWPPVSTQPSMRSLTPTQMSGNRPSGKRPRSSRLPTVRSRVAKWRRWHGRVLPSAAQPKGLDCGGSVEHRPHAQLRRIRQERDPGAGAEDSHARGLTTLRPQRPKPPPIFLHKFASDLDLAGRLTHREDVCKASGRAVEASGLPHARCHGHHAARTHRHRHHPPPRPARDRAGRHPPPEARRLAQSCLGLTGE